MSSKKSNVCSINKHISSSNSVPDVASRPQPSSHCSPQSNLCAQKRAVQRHKKWLWPAQFQPHINQISLSQHPWNLLGACCATQQTAAANAGCAHGVQWLFFLRQKHNTLSLISPTPVTTEEQAVLSDLTFTLILSKIRSLILLEGLN